MKKKYSEKLVSSIAAWYAIPPQFVEVCLNKFAVDLDLSSLLTIQDLLDHYPERRVQLEYAFSTNVRGKELSNTLVTHKIISSDGKGLSYLDVGCAYGGFVNAFEQLGYEGTGIELNQDLIELCMYNTKSPEKIFNGDYLDFNWNKIKPSAGFNVITCNDVIEHVSDPLRGVECLIENLCPGGTLYLETVNRNSYLNVINDIHFQIFGLNLLPYSIACQYYQAITKNDTYTVGDFYSCEWYRNTAKQCGAESFTLSDYEFTQPFHIVVQNLLNAYDNWYDNVRPGLSFFLKRDLETYFTRYLSEITKAYADNQETNDRQTFIQDWIDPLLRIVIIKPSAT